jgi:hypothetical protein
MLLLPEKENSDLRATMPGPAICAFRLSPPVILVLACAVWIASGCGGAGGSSAPNPPANDFSISASVTNLSLGSGQSQSFNVSVAEVNTFTSGGRG